MSTEYFKPMLDVGSPRVFNINLLTQRILAADPAAPTFFKNKPFNNIVLIKDTLPLDMQHGKQSSPIGTKLFFPFNDKEVYEGGRTIFASDNNLERILTQTFGEGAIGKEALAHDVRILRILDRLPSLDPFLLKDVFLNEGLEINPSYFELTKEVWEEIEVFILRRFESVVKAAYPDASASDDKAKRLIEKIWEARDVVALKPLIDAFRLPPDEALEIFSAWKGINFYSFQYERSKSLFVECFTWIKDLQLPPVPISGAERAEFKASIEQIKTQLRAEWHKVDTILKSYQDSYDKMFKYNVSSVEFVTFLKNSKALYWELGNSLGKTGHASYCWNTATKRFPDRRLPWEQLHGLITLMSKIFQPEKKAMTSVAWN